MARMPKYIKEITIIYDKKGKPVVMATRERRVYNHPPKMDKILSEYGESFRVLLIDAAKSQLHNFVDMQPLEQWMYRLQKIERDLARGRYTMLDTCGCEMLQSNWTQFAELIAAIKGVVVDK